MTNFWKLGFLLLIVVLAGCGGSDYASPKFSSMEKLTTQSDAFVAADGAVGAGENIAAMAPADRKIIYEADLRLVADDFATVESALPKLVKEHGGFLADISIDRTSGSQRSGNWTARIPVDRYDEFLASASELGTPENVSQTAQDVTEEFVDIEARIASKKKLEERITQLLEERPGKLADVIEIERELARVRSEIEQMEGRLRYLTNRTDLTTVRMHIREERNYTPPAAPGFATRIQSAWSQSIENIQQAGEQLVISLVILAPWIAVLLLLLFPFVLLWRRWRKKRAARVSE